MRRAVHRAIFFGVALLAGSVALAGAQQSIPVSVGNGSSIGGNVGNGSEAGPLVFAPCSAGSLPYITIGSRTILCPGRTPPPTATPTPSGVQAVAADSVADANSGINIHVSYRNTGYQYALASGTPAPGSGNTVQGLMQQLGMRHYRDAVSTNTADCADYAAFAATGATGLFITSTTSNPDSQTSLQAFVNCIGAGAPTAAEAFEPQNESVNSGNASTFVAYQTTLYNAAKALTGTSLPPTVVGPSTTAESQNTALGDLSAHEDAGNSHVYFGGFYPGTSGWGSTDAYGTYATWSYNFNINHLNALTKPMWVTESGFGDNLADNLNGYDTVQPRDVTADYALADLMDALTVSATNQYTRMYRYELIDLYPTSCNTTFCSYGLADTNLYVKPAGVAVANFTKLLADPGAAFAPGKLNYTLSGFNASTKSYLAQKRDGTFYLVVWNDANLWNNNAGENGARVTPADQTGTVSFGTVPTSIRQWTINQNGDGAASFATLTPSASVSATLHAAHVSVFQIAMSGTPSPAPTLSPPPTPTPSPTPVPTATPVVTGSVQLWGSTTYQATNVNGTFVDAVVPSGTPIGAQLFLDIATSCYGANRGVKTVPTGWTDVGGASSYHCSSHYEGQEILTHTYANGDPTYWEFPLNNAAYAANAVTAAVINGGVPVFQTASQAGSGTSVYSSVASVTVPAGTLELGFYNADGGGTQPFALITPFSATSPNLAITTITTNLATTLGTSPTGCCQAGLAARTAAASETAQVTATLGTYTSPITTTTIAVPNVGVTLPTPTPIPTATPSTPNASPYPVVDTANAVANSLSGTITTPTTPSPGTGELVAVSTFANNETVTVTDSSSNAWTRIAQVASTGNFANCDVFYKRAGSGEPTTVNVNTFGGNYFSAAFVPIKNIDAAVPYIVQLPASPNSNTAVSFTSTSQTAQYAHSLPIVVACPSGGNSSSGEPLANPATGISSGWSQIVAANSQPNASVYVFARTIGTTAAGTAYNMSATLGTGAGATENDLSLMAVP